MPRKRVEYTEVHDFDDDDSDERRSLLNATGSVVGPDSRDMNPNPGPNSAPASSIPMVQLKTTADAKESKDQVIDSEEKMNWVDEVERILEGNQESDQDQDLREIQESFIAHLKRELCTNKRFWGFILYWFFQLTATLIWLCTQKSGYKLKRTMSLLTLFSFFITFVWLNAYELLYGLGLFFLMNPAISWTIKDTSGMWIGNVGFGISFAFGIIAKGLSASGSKKVLILWYLMSMAMALIVYFPLELRKHHNAAVTVFITLFIIVLVVEQCTSTIVVGWFQLALCFVLVGLLVMGVESVFHMKKIKTCAPGLYRNQLYILFSFLFYLIGVVVRDFRTYE